MTPEERELRHALEARSGEPSPQFHARLSAALDESRPGSRLMPALAMVTVLAITLGTVGVLLMSRAGLGGPASGTRYAVISSLMSDPSGPFRACTEVPASAPSPGCYGVDVANVDAAAIPGIFVNRNGTIQSPTVRLVGTWDSRLRVLRLTEPPVIVDQYASTPPKVVTQPPPPRSGNKPEDVLQQITRDAPDLLQRGIALLGWGEDVDGVEMDLAVADAKSVQYLYDTYGRMKIKGWLQPAGASTASPHPPPSTRATLPPMTAQLIAPSSTVVWAFAGGFLFRSIDRGSTWEQRPLPPVQLLRVGQEFSFVDAQQGWYLARGEVWQTKDGATTWRKVSARNASEGREGLSFVDPTHGFAAARTSGPHPTLYRTVDGGQTWSGTSLPDPPDFASSNGLTLQAGLVKRRGNALYVLAWGEHGDFLTDRQYIYRSIDGGVTWSWMTKIPSRYVVMVTESRWLHLIVPGQSTESTNSGQQWHPYASDFNIETLVGGPQIVFGDSLVGYAEIRGALQRTVDGGLHWVRIAMPGTFPAATPPAKATCTIEGAAAPRALWSRYSSPKLGYSMDYPADWCNIPSFGVSDSYKYFSNENVGSPPSMSPAGIWLTLGVASGACPASPRVREVYDQTVLMVAGQEATRTYGWVTPGVEQATQLIHAAIAHGSSCYTFDFVTQTRGTGDKYLAIADQMITSLRFT
jgi:photosystem II stability/assembly factor-like uncharacterized protein